MTVWWASGMQHSSRLATSCCRCSGVLRRCVPAHAAQQRSCTHPHRGVCSWYDCPAELEAQTGIAEKTLAEFIVDVAKGARNVDGFKKVRAQRMQPVSPVRYTKKAASAIAKPQHQPQPQQQRHQSSTLTPLASLSCWVHLLCMCAGPCGCRRRAARCSGRAPLEHHSGPGAWQQPAWRRQQLQTPPQAPPRCSAAGASPAEHAGVCQAAGQDPAG